MDDSDLMSDRVEVQRIDRTGTIWFAATLIGVAIVAASLVLSGWRPAQLPEPAQVAWWIGFGAVTLGLGGIGYAGCPIYWGNVSVAHAQKSVTIRAGLVLFLLGSVTMLATILAN